MAAAWVVWKHLKGQVELVACAYRDSVPYIMGRDVIIVDFSFNLEDMKNILNKCRTLTWIDHHKTALESLPELSAHDLEVQHGKLITYTGLHQSGCGLAWSYYFPDEPLPNPLTFIEDRDLWRFALPYTKPVTTALYNHELTVGFIDHVVESFSDPLSTFAAELVGRGTELLRAQQRQVDMVMATNLRHLIIGGKRVPVCNAPFFMASDLGHALVSKLNPPFAATYHDTLDKRIFSLRSHDDGDDVSAVAKKYGGGGHRNAAGFSVPLGWEGE